jgi:aldehyde:ferredoxin oxidoreductase
VDGYAGKVLEINLTEKTVKVSPLDTIGIQKYLGGRGYAAALLYQRLKPNTNPLSPENLLIFATGPLTGLLPSKYAVITKSPLTNLYLDTFGGGHFGPEMKFAGYDLLLIVGRAEDPSYIWISDEHVEIKSGVCLWGKGCSRTERLLKKNLGEDIKVASIGQAGERLVKFACITNDVHRQAGRGGAGAVMGSKNLKAIAIKGSGYIELHDRQEFQQQWEATLKLMKTSNQWHLRKTYGSPYLILPRNYRGELPTRNWSTGVFESAKKLSGEHLKETLVVKDDACHACPIGCGKVSNVKKGPYKGTVIVGPEYETITFLGSNCGIDDLETITYANKLCDDWGLDTISTGNVIAFAMEHTLHGNMPPMFTDKLNLAFQNRASLIDLIRMIAERKDLGHILAEGVKRASQELGGTDYAIHVKGLELSMADPRGTRGRGLQYMTSDIGGHHMRGAPYLKMGEPIPLPTSSAIEIVEVLKTSQDIRSALNCLIVCTVFTHMSGEKVLPRFLSAVSNIKMTFDEFRMLGERIYNLVRAFNVREGLQRFDDSLPKRFMDESMPTGYAMGCRAFYEPDDAEKALSAYYRVRGWDAQGKPTKEKLKELSLSELLDG